MDAILRTTIGLLRRGSSGALLVLFLVPGAGVPAGAASLFLFGLFSGALQQLGLVFYGPFVAFSVASVPFVVVLGWLHGFVLDDYARARVDRPRPQPPGRGYGSLALAITSGLSAGSLLLLPIGAGVVALACSAESGVGPGDRPGAIVAGVSLSLLGGYVHARSLLAPACAVIDGVGARVALARAWRAWGRARLAVTLVALGPFLFVGAFAGNVVNPLVTSPELRRASAALAVLATIAAYFLHAALVVATWDVLSRESVGEA